MGKQKSIQDKLYLLMRFFTLGNKNIYRLMD